MKKFFSLLLAGLFSLAATEQVFAQCTPGGTAPTAASPVDFTPDRDSLPQPKVGVAYEEVIQFGSVPAITTPINLGTIQEAQLWRIKNLPAGFTYEVKSSNPTDQGGVFTPASAAKGPEGCIVVKGTATAPFDVTLTLVLSVKANQNLDTTTLAAVLNGASPGALDFKFTATGSGPTSVNEAFVKSTALNVFPSPAGAEATVRFNLAETANVAVTLTSLDGREVATQTLTNAVGTQDIKFELGNVPAGLYLVRLTDGTSTATQKFIKY